MTIASTMRKAGPFTGNGIQSAWPFTFKVFTPADVRVTLADGSGAETVLVLDADYTVTLNSNQETSPGGTVNYLLAGGSRLVLTSQVSYDQPLDLPSGGNYNPQALENQLDRTVMQIQQLSEELGRAVKVPVTEEGGDGQLSGELAQGILALVPEIDAINAVRGELPAVVAVANKTAAVQTVADNLASVTNFADVYQGAKTSDPLVRNDNTALQTGDLYFNVASGVMRIYATGGWSNIGEAIPLTISSFRFNGTGAQTAFTLPVAPAFEAACDVYIAGVHQVVDIDYNVTGTSLVFTSAPPAGTGNIEVKIFSPISVGVPNNGSVTTAKLGDGAVTAQKAAPSLVPDLLGFTPADAATVAYEADVTAALANKADTSALTSGLATKADLAGNSGQAFAVGTATSSEHAVRRGQVLGLGQTWQVLTDSRAFGTTYTNTTGRPICVAFYASSSAEGAIAFIVDGAYLGPVAFGRPAGSAASAQLIVPPGATYQLSVVSGNLTLINWIELR